MSFSLRNILHLGAAATVATVIVIGWKTGFFAAIPSFVSDRWADATTWVSNLDLGQIMLFAGPAFFLILLLLFLLDR